MPSICEVPISSNYSELLSAFSEARRPLFGYMHREYKNDITSDSKLAKYAVLTLPFLCLFKPLIQPITIGLNVSHSITCLRTLIKNKNTDKTKENLAQLALSTAILALTIINPTTAVMMVVCRDVIIESKALIKNINQYNKEKIKENSLNLINHALYLLVSFADSKNRGPCLAALSLFAQVFSEIYRAKQEFKDDNKLEGRMHIVMAFLRTQQMFDHLGVLIDLQFFDPLAHQKAMERFTKRS